MVVSYTSLTTGGVILKDTARREFLECVAADALEHLRVQPEVNSSRVGVVGFSLGGHFALHLAAGRTPPEAAVVYYGVYPTAERLMLTVSAPLLICRADATTRSLFRQLTSLREWLLHMGGAASWSPTPKRSTSSTFSNRTDDRLATPGSARALSSVVIYGEMQRAAKQSIDAGGARKVGRQSLWVARATQLVRSVGPLSGCSKGVAGA
jgi:pimeloyl-ACP methyl ester carboxylesterase